MNTSKDRRFSFARSLIGLAACFGVAMTATHADAAESPTTTVNAVEFSGGTLLIQLSNGTNYLGVLNTGGACTANNQTADTLKAWTSLSQSALLSGKRLKLYFTTCNSTNYINVVDLWN
ncbi:MAG: hypothetical protein K0R38_6912 [Polyangiaceae bacterium]|jgi:hypothetical protein|nr:hypothetical protein [Polyangiaceae bacterium]